MRRRPAFTLVEMLVSVALVLFIMVILTEAFGKGLDSFRTLKAIGDMETRLRSATAILRKDLAADHFEGKRRLSDDPVTWKMAGPPREGFFRLVRRLNQILPEGFDSDQIASDRTAASILHFTVKMRGNDRSQFFSARVSNPLFWSRRTNFFNQPDDARFQEPQQNGAGIYSSQWAEVAYWLQANGGTAGGTPLYTLYRSQFVLVADNSTVNWDGATGRLNLIQETRPNSDELDEISCRPFPLAEASRQVRAFLVNSPTDINARFSPPDPADPSHVHRRAFNPLSPTRRGATPVLTDVISFVVNMDGSQLSGAVLQDRDTHPLVVTPNLIQGGIPQIALTLRVWDAKTKQTRQMTINQDL